MALYIFHSGGRDRNFQFTFVSFFSSEKKFSGKFEISVTKIKFENEFLFSEKKKRNEKKNEGAERGNTASAFRMYRGYF